MGSVLRVGGLLRAVFSGRLWGFGFGRLLGYMCGRVYVKMWFDDRHVKKIEGRMEENGCVRSKRHLVKGGCPSAGEA